MFFANGVDLSLCGKSGCDEKLALNFVGAHSIPESTSALTGHASYFLGDDSARWIRNIPLSSEIEYKDLYPGISLSFYGNGQELEHDFSIAPGADPSRIVLRFDGATRIVQTSDGDLEIHTAKGALTLRRPVAYQQTGTNRTAVDAAFVQAGDGSIGFRVGTYDRRQPLVIDPVIVFASYLGGQGTDLATAITTDANGDVLVTGSTSSTDFPTANALQSSLGSNGQSIFVTKFDPTGKTLIYSTYLGGSSQALGAPSATGGAIAVDANGNAIIAGLTSSANFPVAGAGTLLSCQINNSCFVLASLSPDGSTLNYSGTVGGEQGFYIFGTGVNLAVDATGNAYLAGTTDNSNFQITAGTLAPSVPDYPYNETFVLKVDPTGKLVYSTVIPGTDTNSTDLLQPYTNDFIPTGIAVDTSGDVTIAGTTGLGLPATSGVVSPQFPNAYVNVENPTAGFVLQINPSASAINFATYLPGTDHNGGLTVDATGNLYLTGGTGETNLPVSANAYQKTIGPNSDGQYAAGYIMELNPQATAVVAATYVGANSVTPYGFSGIALDSQGNVFAGGYVSSQSFPLQNPFVTEYEYTGSTADMILAEMSPDLSTLEFGSFFNATSGVYAGSAFAGLAVDSSNNLVVAGITYSSYFPTTSGSFEPQLPPPANPNVGLQHSFVAKFDMSTPAPAVCFGSFSVSFGNVNANSSSTQTLNVTNCGNAALNVSAIASSDPTVTASGSCTSVTPGSICPVTLTFTPVNSNATSGTITLTDNAQTIPQSVSFTGQGVAPEIVARVNPVSFGHALVGATAISAVLPISNGGKAALSVGTITVSGAGYSLINNGCTSPLPVNQYFSCPIEIAFAPVNPGTQTGSVVIASNDPAMPQLTVGLTGVGDAVYAVPSISSISTPTVLINSGDVNLSISGANFYPESVAKLNGAALSTTFQSNNSLKATIPASSLTAIGEQGLTVVNPTPGGGASAPVAVTPYQTLAIDPSALVSVPATGMLYAAIPASATNNPNTVIPINPATGAEGTPIPVGNDPRLLAASPDGSYLYVANQGNYTLERVNLQTNAVDRTFPYTPNLSCSTCTNLPASDLMALPGTSREVLLSQGSVLSLYNDSGIVNYVSSGSCCYADPDFGSIALAGAPLTVYGLPFSFGGGYFQMANVTSSGLQYTLPHGSTSGFNTTTGAQVVSDGTLLYTSAGQVWNPATQTEIGTFPVTSINITSYPNMRALNFDSSLGQIYWVGYQDYASPNSSLAAVISAYGMKSYALTGTLAFPQIDYPFVGSLVRWGTNGLAFIGPGAGQTDQEVYILSSSIVSPQAGDPVSTTTSLSIAPSGGTITEGSSYTLTATVSAASGTSTPTGNVVFTIGGTSQTAVLNSSGTATYTDTAPSAPGSLSISASYEGAPGFRASTSSTLVESVSASGNPIPAVSGLSPVFTTAGTSNFTLTVAGSGFVSTSTVYWGSTALATQFVSATQLTAQVTANQIAAAGISTITVQTSAPGGGVSNSMQFEVDSAGAGSGPSFTTLTATVSPGSAATYQVTVPSSATNVSVNCLNLPIGASCTYSAAAHAVTIATSAATPAGTYQITVVFTETLPGATTALVFLPIVLLPLFFLRRKWAVQHVGFMAFLALALVLTAATGCGGGSSGNGQTQPQTRVATSSGVVTLTVQ